MEKTQSREELCWLAGLLEGEGWFCVNTPNGRNYPSRAHVGMTSTDRDVIERAAALLGVRVRERKVAKKHWKPQYQIAITGNRSIALLHALLPLMGERRRLQIERCLNAQRRVDKKEEESWKEEKKNSAVSEMPVA